MPESYLENALLKLARQINAFDEASLMDLWEKYAEAVRGFEPTRRWEEAAVAFGIIQAVRMKNQLFNYSLAASRAGATTLKPGLDLLGLNAPEPRPEARPEPAQPQTPPPSAAPAGRAAGRGGSVRQGKPKAGKLIPLRPGTD